MKKKLSDIELHSAGATVCHQSPFEDLISYDNEEDLSQEFLDKWVIPFYFNLKNRDEEWIEKMISISGQVTDEVILKNLGDFNWRTRSTGAYLASIKGAKQFIDIIGIHLLKSEVCFAGSHYAIALASFNTVEVREYLNKYLTHYLTRMDLDFDQHQVMSALKYLDEINGTDFAEHHSFAWKEFCRSRIQRIDKAINDLRKQNADGMTQAFEGHRKFWQENLSGEPVADAIDVINKIKAASNVKRH